MYIERLYNPQRTQIKKEVQRLVAPLSCYWRGYAAVFGAAERLATAAASARKAFFASLS